MRVLRTSRDRRFCAKFAAPRAKLNQRVARVEATETIHFSMNCSSRGSRPRSRDALQAGQRLRTSRPEMLGSCIRAGAWSLSLHRSPTETTDRVSSWSRKNAVCAKGFLRVMCATRCRKVVRKTPDNPSSSHKRQLGAKNSSAYASEPMGRALSSCSSCSSVCTNVPRKTKPSYRSTCFQMRLATSVVGVSPEAVGPDSLTR